MLASGDALRLWTLIVMGSVLQHRRTLATTAARGRCGTWAQVCCSISAPSCAYHLPITGGLIHSFEPLNHWTCSVIFSHVDADVLFGVSDDQTVRLSLADGSVTEFSGHSGNHYSQGHAMKLSEDGAVLYVGYYSTKCVVAYDVATLQLMWKAGLDHGVHCLTCHDGLMLAALCAGPVTVLSAEDGSVVRTLVVVDGIACGISVFAGLGCVTAVTSLLTHHADQPASSLKFSN